MNRVRILPFFGLLLVLGVPARALPSVALRRVSVVGAYAGSGPFTNLHSFWLDRTEGSFFILDDNPLTIYKFDHLGNSLKYYRIADMMSQDTAFSGAGPKGVYVHNARGTFVLSPDFTALEPASFYFAPAPAPGQEQQKIPLDFSQIFPHAQGVYGYDPEKQILYDCDADRLCHVLIRTVMKYGPNVLTGHMKSVTRDSWGRFFFVDSQARKVWKFSSNGDFLGSASGSFNPLDDRMYSPDLVAMDRMKRCFIYDAGVRRLKVYDDIGILRSEIDANGPEGPVFIYPAAMDIDDNNRLFVLDAGDMTVKIFDIVDQ